MISKTLSTSAKRAALHQAAPDLAEFCQQLYPLLVAHSDDFGRLAGDAFTVKHAIDPTSPRPLPEFERALQALNDVELIVWYQVGTRKFIQIQNFDSHQIGLHRRSASTFPAPPGSSDVIRATSRMSALSASEKDLEEYIAEELSGGRISVDRLTVVTLQRQVRVLNSYCDIVIDTAQGLMVIIEVKRQRVTAAAIDQVLGYRDLMVSERGVLKESIVPVVIGHGLAVGLDVSRSDVLVATISEDLDFTNITAFHVNGRQLTLITYLSVPSEEKGTEGKRTERKKGVSVTTPSVVSPALLTFPTVGQGPKTWELTEAQRAEWQELYPGLDVLGECRGALGWVRTNQPKTASGMPRFLVNWFNRAVARGGATGTAARSAVRGGIAVPAYTGPCPGRHEPRCIDAKACGKKMRAEAQK